MKRNRLFRLVDMRLALAALAMVAAGAELAQAATLRANVVVHDDTVRLRDIFEDAGGQGDAALFRAPAPGESVVLPGKWLRQVARAYGLDWRPAPGLDESRVQRSSNRVGPDVIVAAVKSALEKHLADGKRYDITLDNPGQEIHLPIRMPSSVTVRNLFFDPHSNRYSATIVAPDARPGAVSLSVAGRVHEVIAVPVLSRRFRPGEIIRQSDLDTHYVRAEQMGRSALIVPAQIVGKSARRSLLGGKTLNESDLREPVLVTRGNMVIMRYETQNIVITAHGTARENGTAGDTVRVRNMNSGKIVEAVVTGQDTVKVMPLSIAQGK